MKARDVRTEKQIVKVVRFRSSHVGCHGESGLEHEGRSWYGNAIGIPVSDLPPGSVVDVEIRVTVLKRGRKLPTRCENPWPSHICPKKERR